MATSLMGSRGMKPPKGYDFAQIPTMSPESYDLWRNLLSRAGGGALSGLDLLGKLGRGDESTFEALEKPYKRQFSESMGNLASRFSGQGMGARQSSGFRGAAAGGAQQLSELLGSQRLGLQKDAITQLLQLSEMLLGKQPSQYGLVSKQPSGWEQLLGGLGKGFGAGIGMLPGMFML